MKFDRIYICLIFDFFLFFIYLLYIKYIFIDTNKIIYFEILIYEFYS